MGLRTHNPITPGVRGRVSPDFAELTKGNEPVKALSKTPSRYDRPGRCAFKERMVGGERCHI